MNKEKSAINELETTRKQILTDRYTMSIGEIISLYQSQAVKHSGSKSKGKKAIHIVNAWATEQRLVLG